jgi:methyl-coenzyme M reductase gamma subunit
MYHSMVGPGFRDDPECVESITRIHELRVKYGFMPKEA